MMKGKTLSLLFAAIIGSALAADTLHDDAVMLSFSRSSSPSEGLLIEILPDNVYLLDSGRELRGLNEMEAYLKENGKRFSPRIIVDSIAAKGKESGRVIDLLFLCNKYSDSYSLLIEKSPAVKDQSK